MNKLLNAPLRRLDPLNDYLFYKVFGEKGCEVQLLGFLNAVLYRIGDDSFTSVEILEDKTFTPEMIGDKSVIFDVRAILQGRTRVDVEAQIRDQHNMERRSLFYWGREFVKTLKSGGKYQDIPDVMAIDIVGFDFPRSENYHTCFHLREDREPELILTNSLEIHFINMVQYRRTFRSRLRKKNRLLIDFSWEEPLVRWLVWFNQKSPPELLAEVKNMDSAIQAADDRLVYLSGDEDAIRAYEVRFKAECDWASEQAYSIETGIKKGKLEVARKMKDMGDSVERIHTITGLSPEDITKL